MFGATSSIILTFIIVLAYFSKDYTVHIYTNFFGEALLEAILLPMILAITLYSNLYYLIKEKELK